MYMTTTISVALVLFLIGLECVLGLSTRQVMTDLRENVVVSAVVSDTMQTADSLRIDRLLQQAPFCREYHFVSKEEALSDHIANLGEDPAAFLGYNPLQASFEIRLSEAYAHPDSVVRLDHILRQYPFVTDVYYPRDVVTLMSQTAEQMALVLLGLALVLLIVSLALITNTIRLHVYSKRFNINTQKLVGATPWMIKWPIVRRSVFVGLCAALLALMCIAGLLWYADAKVGMRFIQYTYFNLAIIAGVVIACGMLITFFASVFAVNRYIRMKTDQLYYV